MQVSAGSEHSLAVDSNGDVWAWGNGNLGRLGTGNVEIQTSPVKVNSDTGMENIVQVAAGNQHSLALDSNGDVWAWGQGSFGKLGNGAFSQQTSPVRVSDVTGLKNVVHIAAANDHSIALDGEGKLWGWGRNQSSQLGMPSLFQTATPIEIDSLSNIRNIYVKGDRTFMIDTDSDVWEIRLKSSPIDPFLPPAKVSGMNSIDSVSLMSSTLYGLAHNGDVWAKTGSGNAQKITWAKDVTQLSTGISHAFFLNENGELRGWGDARNGKLGLGKVLNETRSEPTTIPGAGTFKQIVAGTRHTLLLQEDGDYWGWGQNSNRELGINLDIQNPGQSRLTPVKAEYGHYFKMLSAGSTHSLGLDDDGRVWAWGNGNFGMLGTGDETSQPEPVMVNDLSNIVQVVASGTHSLAVGEDGDVWAWGNASSGRLGVDPSPGNQSSPMHITGLNNIKQVYSHGGHNLAVDNSGDVWAWGFNFYGQIGNGGNSAQLTPFKVNGLSNIVHVMTGSNHSLAIDNNGDVWTWGHGGSGQLGHGDDENQFTPKKVTGISNVVQLAAGELYSLALDSSGKVWAWGYGGSGQLGTGDEDTRYTPHEIDIPAKIVQISAGPASSRGTGATENGHSIALDDTGVIWGWGDGKDGKLGNGVIAGMHLVPEKLEIFTEFPSKRTFAADRIVSPKNEELNGDFVTRTYNIPSLEPGESFTYLFKGKVNRPSHEAGGLVLASQATATFSETPRTLPVLPNRADTGFPQYDEDDAWAYGKWDTIDGCTATDEWVTPGDGCDAVRAQLPGMPSPLGSEPGTLSGYLWFDENQDGEKDNDEPIVPGTEVQLFKSEPGSFENRIGSAHTNDDGFYIFEDLEADDGTDENGYWVSFNVANNPTIADVGGGNPRQLLSPGESRAWTAAVGAPMLDESVTNSSGYTDMTLVVDEGLETKNVNGGITLFSTGLTVLKGHTDTDGNLVQHLDAELGETYPVTVTVVNTGTEPISQIRFEDETTVGPDVEWNQCVINDPATTVDITSANSADGVFEFPAATELAAGETMVCEGVMPALTEAADEHADTVTVTAVSSISETPLSGNSDFEATLDPLSIPVPSVKIEKGILDSDSNTITSVDEFIDVEEDEPIDLVFRVTNTGEEPLLDMDVADVTILGTDDVSDLTCNWDVEEINGTNRSYLAEGDSVDCAATLTLSELGAVHENEATVWAVGATSGKLVNDTDMFKAKVPTEVGMTVLKGSKDAEGNFVQELDADLGEKYPVTVTIVNTGNEPLTELRFEDVTNVGPDVEWAECAVDEAGFTLAPSESLVCEGVMPALTDGAAEHSDTVTVNAVSAITNTQIEDSDTFTATMIKEEPPVVDPPVINPPVTDPPIIEPPVIDPPVTDNKVEEGQKPLETPVLSATGAGVPIFLIGAVMLIAAGVLISRKREKAS